MHILGLANGTPAGNSEILLKAALSAAAETSSSVTVSWVHIPSVSIPPNAPPLKGTQDVSMGMNDAIAGVAARNKNGTSHIPDDRQAVLNGILDADALIFSTPVYSHQPAGTLKSVIDKIMGPYTDAAFATRALERQKAGDPQFQNQKIDQRLLKPRVVGFICTAGSTTPDQVTMALPTLHLFVYSLHAKVVDQVVFYAVGQAGYAAIAEGGDVLKRAQQLGRNVASQLGKSFDDARYLGPQPRGACPYCHLAKVDLLCTADNSIGCVTCGAQGKLVVGEDGTIAPVWEQNCGVSSITMLGKRNHIDDIVTNGKKEMQKIKDDPNFEEKKDRWTGLGISMLDLPSNRP